MTIKALIFDFGGVLMRTEDQAPRRMWEARYGLKDWGLAELVFGNPFSTRATIGQADTEAIWQHVAEQLKLQAQDLAELQRDFWAGDRLDTVLIDFVAGQRGMLRTAILSNAWPDARIYFSSHPEIRSAFDLLVISAEEGVAKPDPEIYRRALDRLSVEAGEAIFVDDMPANVEGAQALGLAGILFQDREQVLGELEKLLLSQ